MQGAFRVPIRFFWKFESFFQGGINILAKRKVKAGQLQDGLKNAFWETKSKSVLVRVLRNFVCLHFVTRKLNALSELLVQSIFDRPDTAATAMKKMISKIQNETNR